MQKVAPDFTLPRSRAARGERIAVRIAERIARTTDGQLALFVSAVLFVVAAWPLMLVQVPPYQDLPNHLAAVTVIEHPSRYPEFVFNGYFKTNSVLFTWLLVVGRLVGVKAAARLFAFVVVALGAFAYPRFVLSLAGRRSAAGPSEAKDRPQRRKMIVSAFFAWPMVHNWYVSMGMLDFALGVPLAMLLLVVLNAQRQKPAAGLASPRAAAIALLALLTWYAHVFPLLVVHLLVVVHAATRRTWRERIDQARALVVPMLPASALVALSLWGHFTEPVGAMTGYVALGRLLPPWELFYNSWAEWFYGFTWLEIATIVPCLVAGLWAIHKWRDDVPFFGPIALLALAAFYFFAPYTATNWFHVNSRFVPFLWLAALLRLPDRMPRWLLAALGVCAVTYGAGMGVDYVRLDRESGRFTAGIGAVPEGSKLLPLVFESKGTSENTRSLLHAWGFYVVEKQTSAPLLFAHSRSFPVMYRDPPPSQFNHLVLESFAPTMRSPDWMCAIWRTGGVAIDDCARVWREKWGEFWREATPAYDHVLMWSAPEQVRELVPSDYRVAFQRDELVIFERVPPR